jgi:hypothetical protein
VQEREGLNNEEGLKVARFRLARPVVQKCIMTYKYANECVKKICACIPETGGHFKNLTL